MVVTRAEPAGFDELIRLYDDGHYPEAETYGRSLMARLEAEGQGDSLDMALVIDRFVFILLRGGKGTQPDTLDLANRGLRIREQSLGPSHPDVAQSLTALAYVYYRRGEYAQARPLFERALAIREKAAIPNDEVIDKIRHNFANLLADMGDYTGARILYEQALVSQERLFGPDSPRVAMTLDTLAIVLHDLGDAEGAAKLFEREIPLQEKLLGPDHPVLAVALDSYAVVLDEMGDTDRAIDLERRALAIREAKLGPDRPQVAASLNNLAGYLTRTGQGEAARPMFARALRIWESAYGLDHPAVAHPVIGLADLDLARGDLEAARRGYERAVSIRETRLGTEHPLTAEAAVKLSRLQLTMGEDSVALDGSLRAEKTLREQVRRMARRLSDRDALKYETLQASGLDVAESALIRARSGREALRSRTGEIWDAVIRARAQVLDEMATRHRDISELRSPALVTRLETLDAARGRLSALIAGGPQDDAEGFKRRLQEARDTIDAAERALARDSLAFRGDQDRSRGGLPEILAALPGDTVLLAFTLFNRLVASGTASEPWYMAWVLAPGGGPPRAYPIGPAATIDPLIQTWRVEAGTLPADEQASARYQSAGTALRKAIWDPVAPAVRRAAKVLIVPDGVVHLVNFATLPDKDGYLVESGPTMHYLSTEQDLLGIHSRPRRNGGLLALGGVDFDALPLAVEEQRALLRTSGWPDAGEPVTEVRDLFRGALPACDAFRAVRFPALPGSGDEAAEVAKLWRGTPEGRGGSSAVLLTGRQAGEGILKRLAPQAGTLHLATHAISIDGACDARRTPAASSLLHISGLILAGANHRGSSPAPDGEDGILTSEEIASLDLRGIDWVVLSACQTGLGTVLKGEGIFGLRRSFQIAGARTLIMSLWPVTDHDAREWIVRLYRARLAGQSSMDSVRAADRAVLEARRSGNVSTHPFFWGAFVAAGDTN
ncbi:MAG TPA: CHAT domain-containing tetratricopeptide repeat protein [Patescibacteria group bacterium]|nr:CHAT domain-containing tetratricopeptide repeat protein [Patescibacteria group bacterium]